MDIDQLKHLLAKYAEGYTTLEEEKVLQDYFAEERENDPDLLSWKQHFILFSSGRDFKISAGGLEARIKQQIDDQNLHYQPVSRRLNFHHLLMAASIALIIGISGIVFYMVQSGNKDTYADPQLAYIETQKALLYVSQKMNTGIKPLSNISKINTGTEQLKSLEKMDQSLGMLNLVSFINRSSNLKK